MRVDNRSIDRIMWNLDPTKKELEKISREDLDLYMLSTALEELRYMLDRCSSDKRLEFDSKINGLKKELKKIYLLTIKEKEAKQEVE